MTLRKLVLVAGLGGFVWSACEKSAQAPTQPTEKGGAAGKTEAAASPLAKLPLGLDEFGTKIPENNPVTPAKVELGKHLYFDPRLSKDGTISCATCHDPAKGWADNEPTSTGIGHQKGNKNSPTVINRLFSTDQFWDGRAKSLEEQALGPVANPVEMGNTLEGMIANVNLVPGYKPFFKAAFGDEKVTQERIAMAIASFERTVLSGNSPFDRYEAGDETAMSESAVRGMQIFRDNQKGRCSICHAGFNFTDEKYHNLGVGTTQPDWEKTHAGRFDVTKQDKDKGAFKTPTLRQLTATAPYMHDGSEATLEATVEFYVKGGNPNPHLDPEMKPLTLTDQEKKDLVEFMKALTGEVTKVEKPALVK